MGFKATLRKGLAIAKKVAESFEEAPSTYTPDSALGKVLQRVSSRLALLTPAICPSMPFRQTSGFIAADLAFETYWRQFLVEAANQGGGTSARNSSGTPFSVDLTIEIGYPGTPTTLVDGSTFSIPDIKAEDAKQIDALMFGGDLFISPTDLGLSVGVRSLGGFYDIGNTKRRARYVLEVVEVY